MSVDLLHFCTAIKEFESQIDTYRKLNELKGRWIKTHYVKANFKNCKYLTVSQIVSGHNKASLHLRNNKYCHENYKYVLYIKVYNEAIYSPLC